MTAPVQREVMVTGMRRVRMLGTYTIPDAALALGKSVPNFRRWINNGLIPAPYLKDRERGYFCFCTEELRIIGRILAEHEREFAYFCAAHEVTSNTIHQAIVGYRAITFGADSSDYDNER